MPRGTAFQSWLFSARSTVASQQGRHEEDESGVVKRIVRNQIETRQKPWADVCQGLVGWLFFTFARTRGTCPTLVQMLIDEASELEKRKGYSMVALDAPCASDLSSARQEERQKETHMCMETAPRLR